MTPREIIAALGMERHPEGGWFTQTFRDPEGGPRGHSTAIYYLLERGERSHWHRVRDAVEIWHYYAGAPLVLLLSANGRDVESLTLGPIVTGAERPQAVVPADCWQAAETTGDFTLVGCTVAPGFEYASFEMAPPDWEPGPG